MERLSESTADLYEQPPTTFVVERIGETDQPDIDGTLDQLETNIPAEVQLEFAASKPEAQSNPQLEWVDAHPGEPTNDRDYRLRMNYRLSNAGFLLDAARSSIQSESTANEWLQLKKAIYSAKSETDIYKKIDAVIAIEDAAFLFATSSGVTESEYNAARMT